MCNDFSSHFSPSFPFFLLLEGNLTQPRWRLVNGSSPAEGRLEYQSDEGDWVCVCGYSTYSTRLDAFDDVCRELGFKQKMTFYDFSSTFLFGRCLGKVFMMVYTDDMSSAIPHVYCRSQDAIGLRCTNKLCTKSNVPPPLAEVIFFQIFIIS